jgi:uncharacterized protein (TIGR03435 family)
MIRTIVGASLIGFTSYAAFGQAPAGPTFEVASVKASKMAGVEGKGRDSVESSPGSLTMRNVSLSACLLWAYDVKEFQLSGPSWLGSDRYDIVAKAAGPAPDAQMKLMMQTLLADRFKLTLHRENKELQVYALVQGKNPPKLRPSDENSVSGAKVTGARVTFGRMSMAQLADLLSRQMDRPVLDMTGLPGLFDFTVDTSSAEAGGEGKEVNPMVTAKIMLGRSLLPMVQEQLGMKVEGRKLPADVLVIDHAERVPTEN